VLGFMTGSRINVTVKEMGRLFVSSDDPETQFFPPLHTFVHLDSLVAADISVVAGKVNWSKRRRKWKLFPGYSKRRSNGRLETSWRWTDINDCLINDHLQFSLDLFPMELDRKCTGFTILTVESKGRNFWIINDSKVSIDD